ncbi:MAG TPA: bifunctional adenosylcobinamide kinase/adenosylcobinamide-phosphate guanylyltransferase [Streptosporangiaceae bacterium]|nr:bifunctional adenosylcobinamide kinase/adenosylcobinamide-phosphate guanylyltransferase [Streptosporangiaceae bacterium]
MGGGEEEIPEGYLVRRLADARDPGRLGGWDVTGPDGGRLLYAAGPGAVPEVAGEGGASGPAGDAGDAGGAGRYDVALLDLLGEPAQLGLLRGRGAITEETITMVAFADHRVASEAELWGRCGFWRVGAPRDGDTVTTLRSEKEEFKDVTTLRGPWRVLVLGGARSGKSERAELRLAGEPDVTYVAAGAGGWDASGGGDAGRDVGAGDAEWAARVAGHRARRPAWWRTVETNDLAGVLTGARGAEGVPGVPGTRRASGASEARRASGAPGAKGVLGAKGASGAQGAVLIDGIGTWLAAVMDECGAWGGSAESGARVAGRIAGLVAAWRQTEAYVVAVSDEAGLGVVPATPAGRLFRDELGRLNQVLAAESEETELVVAGRIFPLV